MQADCEAQGAAGRPHLGRAGQGHDLSLETIAQPILCPREILAGLEGQPEFLGGPEVPGRAQRRVGGDAALGVDDLVDAPGRLRNVLNRGDPSWGTGGEWAG